MSKKHSQTYWIEVDDYNCPYCNQPLEFSFSEMVHSDHGAMVDEVYNCASCESEFVHHREYSCSLKQWYDKEAIRDVIVTKATPS